MQRLPYINPETAVAAFAILFGISAIVSAFTPHLGAIAVFLAVLAALCSGITFYLAKQRKEPGHLVVIASAIALIAILISATQDIVAADPSKPQNIFSQLTPAQQERIRQLEHQDQQLLQQQYQSQQYQQDLHRQQDQEQRHQQDLRRQQDQNQRHQQNLRRQQDNRHRW